MLITFTLWSKSKKTSKSNNPIDQDILLVDFKGSLVLDPRVKPTQVQRDWVYGGFSILYLIEATRRFSEQLE